MISFISRISSLNLSHSTYYLCDNYVTLLYKTFLLVLLFNSQLCRVHIWKRWTSRSLRSGILDCVGTLYYLIEERERRFYRDKYMVRTLLILLPMSSKKYKTPTKIPYYSLEIVPYDKSSFVVTQKYKYTCRLRVSKFSVYHGYRQWRRL